MPNIITHTIFCEEVLKTITNHKYRSIIEAHMEEYRIGTNGPDFFFFHGTFPLRKKNKSEIPMIGTMFHREKINLFYDTAIQTYHAQEEGTLKEAMASYVIGHYLHWQLDSIMHPYVVYRTGFKEAMSTYYHHRFESMMDTMLLDHYRHTSIKHFKTYEICKRSENSVKAIANIYLPCIAKCQNKIIASDLIKASLQDWEKAQRYLYDPNGIKYCSLKVIEKINHTPWYISGNVVRATIDQRYDVMNENHTLWKHPCTGKESFESVYDLMDRAMQEAQIGLSHLFHAMEDQDINPLLRFIDDKTYANGVKGKAERLYKNVIYDK